MGAGQSIIAYSCYDLVVSLKPMSREIAKKFEKIATILILRPRVPTYMTCC